ncbi:unnamed protein product [Rotaria magnacalcarata]|uniref:Reverse transcriptase domain-containing protein n=1 Tax=Rotaria magnacalcarata TaxID=392030 RepID=A0A819KDQ6_9BILA|nr:unnamed protein product [Rotaria magnacalcarata]
MSNSTWNLIAPTLGNSDLKLFSSVALEWHNAPTLESCFSQWKKSVKEDIISPLSDLHVLCFNVRGLDYRWGEVVLLSTQHVSDIVVLTEVGRIDYSLAAAAFPKYQSFYQGGENRNGGVLILVRQGLSTIRHQCNVSNVCVIDILLEESLRIIGVYAPESKSWNWHDINPFVNHNCVLMGDFNIDLQEDKLKREVLLSWTDSHALSPIIPDGPTSLRSHRTIDYAFTSGVHLSLQTYQGDTTSDHLPLLGILACDGKEQALVLNDRGLLPDNQSGFRANHRLQSRVLLLIDQISSLMANSSPVCTIFVDFRSAFDQLWFDGCVGKLSRLGIPAAYVAWIKEWLTNRRGYIDIQGTCSRWFPIKRGGPQGSSLTPSVFITYHSDMSDAFPMAMSFLFADDVAATMAGQMGIKYTDQCIDLEKRLASFFDNLEYYSVLSVQPINYKKTHAMWTARAVSYPNPMPILKCGWSSLINYTLLKIRQRTTLVNTCKYAGVSSNEATNRPFACVFYMSEKSIPLSSVGRFYF